MEDNQLVLSDKQTLAAADSTNTINLIHPYSGTCGFVEFIGHGIGALVTGITVTVKDSADGTTFVAREAINFTDIKALNKGLASLSISKPLRQYVKLTYAVTGAASGAISAYITDKINRPNIYPAKSGRDGQPF